MKGEKRTRETVQRCRRRKTGLSRSGNTSAASRQGGENAGRRHCATHFRSRCANPISQSSITMAICVHPWFSAESPV